MYMCIYIDIYTYTSIYLSIDLSIYLAIYLSICLSKYVCTTSACPPTTARWRGVERSSVSRFTSAPRSTSAHAAGVCPALHACRTGRISRMGRRLAG